MSDGCRSPNARGKTGTMEPGISGPAGYVEWTAPLPLRRYVVCSWTGGLRSGGAGSPEPVLPDGCIDIIWDGERLLAAHVFEDLPAGVPADPAAEMDEDVRVCPSGLPRGCRCDSKCNRGRGEPLVGKG